MSGVGYATASPSLAPILAHVRGEPSRTWSIVVTLFGDAVVPRGGSLWLGTLLSFFEALEIGGNVVRTAMSRLAADGLLERTRIGRNSFYRLAEPGRAMFAAATRRIYGSHRANWDGGFRLAILADSTTQETTRAELEQAGYSLIAPGVLLAIGGGARTRDEAEAIHLRAVADPEAARRLAALVWPPERLGAKYRQFLEAFTPLDGALRSGMNLSDLQALIARVMLIHEYRRIVLRDPLLPDLLLPKDWPGHTARELCAAVYRALLPASESWLDQYARNESGPLPTADSSLTQRFEQP